VLVIEPQQLDCTGVIIDPLHVLTAGHCVVSGNSDSPMLPNAFTVEAGVSNYKHPIASDVRQTRTVSAVYVMPGYISGERETFSNIGASIAHDLAVLTLSRPLDLNGPYARAVRLPTAQTPKPLGSTKIVTAGFGEEVPGQAPTGALNEVVKPMILSSCATNGNLCVVSAFGGACSGDSGSGLVGPGSPPTVIGIVSQGTCQTGETEFAPVDTASALRFINART
jgi:hypothetical protein